MWIFDCILCGHSLIIECARKYLEYFDHRRTPWKCFDFVFQMWSRIENLTNMKRLFHFCGYVSFILHGEKKLKIWENVKETKMFSKRKNQLKMVHLWKQQEFITILEDLVSNKMKYIWYLFKMEIWLHTLQGSSSSPSRHYRLCIDPNRIKSIWFDTNIIQNPFENM